MIFFPNCKINIGLNIIRKRPDGYHDLESMFYPVPLYDVMEIMHSKNRFSFTQSGLETGCDTEKNLVVKAFRVMQQMYQLPDIQIHLHKIIPMGAGLGGGSADAAFIISALNTFFNLDLSQQKLMNLSSRIGSDCPFFILNTPAYVYGRGELVKPLLIELKGYHLILVKPDVHVSTAEAYSLIIPHTPEYALKDSIRIPLKDWKAHIFNDFESPLFVKYPLLDNIKKTLYDKGAIFASMTGSGSAVYGIFDKEMNLQSNFSDCFYWQGIL